MTPACRSRPPHDLLQGSPAPKAAESGRNFPLFSAVFCSSFQELLATMHVARAGPLHCKSVRCFVWSFSQTPPHSRRRTSRVESPDSVWVCWRCNDTDEVSRVRDLSAGGLFVTTPRALPVGTKARLDFLVQEGQIRAEAVVRHIEPANGLGLKFTAVTEHDSPHLAALLTRLRSFSRSGGKL